jgi:hypothetical protein
MPRTTVTLVCAFAPCSQEFLLDLGRYTQRLKYTPLMYCSVQCAAKDRSRTHPPRPLAERFWAKVATGEPDACWPWTGATHANGYGQFRATPEKPGNMSAHIVSWFLYTGAWPPDGLFVCHRCDVKLCVNPAHLFLGTHNDNMADAWAKGRNIFQKERERIQEASRQAKRAHPERRARGKRNGAHTHPETVRRGDTNGMTKVSEAQVAEAVRLYKTGLWTYARLGARYGVTMAAIRRRILGYRPHHENGS